MTTTATDNRGTCKVCKREFKVNYPYELKRRKYCSYACYHGTLKSKWIGKKNPRYTDTRYKKCLQCKKDFYIIRNPKKKFCNISCKGKYYSGERNNKYSGGKKAKVCVVCFKSFYRITNEYTKSKFCSYKCYHSAMPRIYRGENSSNWQGGKDTRKNEVRKNILYRNWQAKVKKRDGHKCKLCGSSKKLEVHHIVPLRDNIKLILKVGNGITLCHNCHKKTFWKENQFIDTFRKILRDYTLNITR